MLNQCQFIGRLGKDPETRTMQNGGKVVSFSLAVSETWKKDGQKQERTTWVPVVIFDERLCDVAERFLKKGSRCYIQGAFDVRKWQDKDGKDRYATEILLRKFAGTLRLLDSKPTDAGGNDAPAADPDDWNSEIPF